MPGFRRFYSPGLEHILHLEELQRRMSRSRISPLASPRGTTAMRRQLALALMALAKRIDPISMPQDGKAMETVS